MFSQSSAACRLNGHWLPLTTIVGIHQFEEVIELGYIEINSHFVFVNKNFASVSCILLLRKATVIWPKIFIFVSFHLYMSQRRSSAGRTTLLSVLGKCRSVPLPYLFVCFLPFKVFLIIYNFFSGTIYSRCLWLCMMDALLQHLSTGLG